MRLNGTAPAAVTRQQPRVAAPAAVQAGGPVVKQAADVLCISDDSDG
jgi:hypothetical protein